MKRLSTALVTFAAAVPLIVVPAFANGEKGEHGEKKEKDAPGHVMVTPDELEWSDAGSLPEGAKVAVLEGDPSAEGPFTLRIKMPPNYTIPAHTHPGTERVTVLDGTLDLAVGEHLDREHAKSFGPGALVVMDPGLPMIGYSGDEPLVIQLNGEGPWGIDYLDPEDDPRTGASE